MRYNYADLEKLFEKINDIIDYVEKHLNGRTTKIYFGNEKDYIKFYISKASVPHLLGIDTNYLTSTGLFKSKNSFDILKEFTANAYTVYNNCAAGHLNQDRIFSEYVNEKINIFTENMRINIHETEFVCKYDSTRSYTANDIQENYDYIIVKKYEDGKIGVIGLIKSDNEYVARSNQVYENINEFIEKFKDKLKNQELTIITQTSYLDNYYGERKFNLTLEKKKEKIENLVEYKDIFNCSIDVSNDYTYVVNTLCNAKHGKINRSSLVDDIVECIAKGNFIEIPIYDEDLKPLVNAFNDFLGNEISEQSTLSYSEMVKNLKEAKETVEILTKENQDLRESNTSLINENNEANEKLKIKTMKLNSIYELSKPSE